MASGNAECRSQRGIHLLHCRGREASHGPDHLILPQRMQHPAHDDRRSV